MGRPYSEDLRERIVRAVVNGLSRREAARRFEVSPSCVVKLLRQWCETGSILPAPIGAPKRSKLDVHAEWLLSLVAREPDITLEEVRLRLEQECGVSASQSTIWYFFDERGISFKKNGARQRAGARRRGGRPASVEGGSAVA